MTLGVFSGIIFANNYESAERIKQQFLNHSGELLSPLSYSYELWGEAQEQDEATIRKILLCHIIKQRDFVAAIMSRYDYTSMSEDEEGIILINYRNDILKQTDDLIPDGITVNQYMNSECK